MVKWKNRKIIIYLLPCDFESGMLNSSHLNSKIMKNRKWAVDMISEIFLILKLFIL